MHHPHAAAPWLIGQTYATGNYKDLQTDILDADGRRITVVNGAHRPGTAALIVAAPILLAALNAVLAQIDDPAGVPLDPEILAQARAAVAQARGYARDTIE